MPIVVNTNAAATTAAFNLSKNHANLSKSLARLSSGNRITQPAEDAGGLAVAYKMSSQIKRTEAVLNNHQNALSYLQVQDGALESVGNIVSRMSELRTMAADVTKNTSDIENYSKEFRELQTQLKQIQLQKFNGISLFSSDAATSTTSPKPNLNVETGTYDYVDHNGEVRTYSNVDRAGRTLFSHPSGLSSDGSISINVSNLQFLLSLNDASNQTTPSNINIGGMQLDSHNGTATHTAGSSPASYTINDGILQNIEQVSIFQFTHIIEKIADARAENGAEQQRIQQSYELHSTNLVNLEAAHGRIMDVDVALESTRFAKHNVLVQASASMTAQANQLSQVALTLLQ
jgi:flagellin